MVIDIKVEKNVIEFVIGAGLVLFLLDMIAIYGVSSENEDEWGRIVGIGQIIGFFIIGKHLAKNKIGIMEAGVIGGLASVVIAICSSITFIVLMRIGFIPQLFMEAGASVATMPEWWDAFLGGFFSDFILNAVIGFIIAFVITAIGAVVEVFFSKRKKKEEKHTDSEKHG